MSTLAVGLMYGGATLFAMFAGMPKAKIAISKADAKANNAAMCALMWKNARDASITTTGTAAMSVESTGLLKGS